MFFGMKTKKEVQQDVDTPVIDNTPIEPYEDEPASWKSLTDAQLAEVWYHLALTNESSDPGIHQPGGDDFLWYMDAAASGNRCAQYTLGKMYYRGVMTPANAFRAGLWFAKASEAGCPFADYELGKMYCLGISMTKDESAARTYFQKAYEAFQKIDSVRQNKAIELKLAVMCENGLVEQADHDTAKHWRDLIAGRNESPASAPQEKQMVEQTVATELQNSGSLAKIDLNKGDLVDVPVEYIIPADNNKYAANDSDEDLRNLAVSIQTNGLINPIVLNQKSKTKYQIISGERRYRAITQFLGWKTIPSIVYYRLSSNRAQLMLHSANLDVREYTPGQKLQFYIETEKLLRKMQQSGEYSGTILKGISELMKTSTHQVRKYQKIVEGFSKKQVKQVINGEMSIERAYKLSKLKLMKQDDTPGRTSKFALEMDVDEGQNTIGRMSKFEPEMDVDEEQNALGRTSSFEPEMDVEKERNTPGRTSDFEPKLDANEEENTPGRVSNYESEKDVNEEQKTLGRTSIFESEKDVNEAQNTPGRTSSFEPELDVEKERNTSGRTSELEDPESYQEAISLLPDLPIEPGMTCAVVNGDGVRSGYVDRIEIYDNALLISVLVDSIRMPFPVSMIGKTVFVGSGCFDQAKRAI